MTGILALLQWPFLRCHNGHSYPVTMVILTLLQWPFSPRQNSHSDNPSLFFSFLYHYFAKYTIVIEEN